MSSAIRISTDLADIDLGWLHPALSERAYWAIGRSRETIQRSISKSLCYSAFDGERQVGFARVITDEATFAWVCDVFVEEGMRGRGVGRQLMEALVADPRLQGLKRMVLATGVPGFYEPFGFGPLDRPHRWMQRPMADRTDH